MDTGKTVTVTLGEHQRSVDARVESGAYESVSDVLRAAVEALAREEAAFEELLRRKVEEALADPRPSVPAEDVFERLEQRYRKDMKAAQRGA